MDTATTLALEEQRDRVRKAFEGLDVSSPDLDTYLKGAGDKKLKKARMSNLAYMGMRTRQPVAELGKVYDTFRRDFAASVFGATEDPGDVGLYNLISENFKREDSLREESQKVAEAATHMGLIAGFGETDEGEVRHPHWTQGYEQFRRERETPLHADKDAEKIYQSVFRHAWGNVTRGSEESKTLAKDLLRQLEIKEGVETEGALRQVQPEIFQRLELLTPEERQAVYTYIQANASLKKVPDTWAANTEKSFNRSISNLFGHVKKFQIQEAIGTAQGDLSNKILLAPIEEGDSPEDIILKVGDATGDIGGFFGELLTAGRAEQITPESEKQIREAASRAQTRLDISRELQSIRQRSINPRKNDEGFAGKIWYPAIEQIGYSALAASWWTMPVLVAATADMNYEEMRAKGFTNEQARDASMVTALIQSGMERVQVKTFLGKSLSRVTEKARMSLARQFSPAGQFSVNLAAQGIFQNVQEGLQDLTPVVVQHFAHALDSEFPEVDWNTELKGWKNTRTDVFLALLPMIMLGAGIGTAVDDARIQSFLKDPQKVNAIVQDAQKTEEIVNAPDIETATKTFQEADKSNPDTAPFEEEMARERELARSFDRPEINYLEDGSAEITLDSGEVVAAPDAAAAKAIVTDIANARADAATVEVQELLTATTGAKFDTSDVGEVAYLEDFLEGGKFSDVAVISPEQARQRIRDLATESKTEFADNGFAQARVYAVNLSTFENGVRQNVVKLFKGARPHNIVEDVSEGYFQKLMDGGERRFLEEELSAYQEASGDVLVPDVGAAPDNSLVEAWSSLATSYFAGKVDKLNLSQRVKKLFDQLATYFHYIFDRAKNIDKAIKEGKVSGRFEQTLVEAVGFDVVEAYSQELQENARRAVEIFNQDVTVSASGEATAEVLLNPVEVVPGEEGPSVSDLADELEDFWKGETAIGDDPEAPTFSVGVYGGLLTAEEIEAAETGDTSKLTLPAIRVDEEHGIDRMEMLPDKLAQFLGLFTPWVIKAGEPGPWGNRIQAAMDVVAEGQPLMFGMPGKTEVSVAMYLREGYWASILWSKKHPNELEFIELVPFAGSKPRASTSNSVGLAILTKFNLYSKLIGIKKINTTAAGSRGSSMTGYKTWPRFGYVPQNEKDPKNILSRAGLVASDRELVEKYTNSRMTFQKFLATPEGPRLWAKYGGTIHMTADLGPDSLLASRLQEVAGIYKKRASKFKDAVSTTATFSISNDDFDAALNLARAEIFRRAGLTPAVEAGAGVMKAEVRTMVVPAVNMSQEEREAARANETAIRAFVKKTYGQDLPKDFHPVFTGPPRGGEPAVGPVAIAASKVVTEEVQKRMGIEPFDPEQADEVSSDDATYTTFSIGFPVFEEALEELMVPPELRIETFQKALDNLRKAEDKLRTLQMRAGSDPRRMERAEVVSGVAQLEAIISALPLSVRGKVRGFSRVAQIPTDRGKLTFMMNRIGRVDDVLSDFITKDTHSKVRRLVDRLKPKTKDGVLKSTLGPDTARMIQDIDDVLDLKPEMLDAHLSALRMRINEPGDAVRIAELIYIAEQYGAFRNLDALDAVETYEHLKEEIAKGRNEWRIKQEERATELQEWRNQALQEMKSPSGVDAEGVARYENEMRTWYKNWTDGIKNFGVSLLSFRDTLVTIFGYGKVSDEMELRALRAKNAMIDANLGARQEMLEWMATTLGISKGRERAEWLNNLKEIHKETGVKNASGVELQLSEDQAIYYTMIYAQKEYRDNLAKHDEITASTIEQMENFISDEGKLYRARLWDLYAKDYNRINRVYRKINGVNMPVVRFYSPASIDVKGANLETDPLNMQTLHTGFSAPFTKMRTKHNLPIKRRGASVVFWAHNEATNHYVTHAEFARDLRAIFLNREIANGILAKKGVRRFRLMAKWVEAIHNDGLRQASAMIAAEEWMQRMLSSLTVIGLSWNVSTYMKQATAGMASLADIPALSWARGVGAAVVSPSRYKELWKSPTFRRRINNGISPEQQEALRATANPSSLLLDMLKRGVSNVGFVDNVFSTLSGSIAYSHHLREAAKITDDPAKQQELALERMDVTIARTAQPTATVDRSIFELTAEGTVWGKSMIMFRSEMRQKLGISLMAYRNLVRSDATFAERAGAVRAFTAVWIFMALITYTMTELFRDAFRDGDEDDDDFLHPKKVGHYLTTGQSAGIPILGDALEFASATAWDQPAWNKSDNHLVDAMGQALKAGEDVFSGEFGNEDLLKDINKVARAMGIAIGGTPGMSVGVASRVILDAKEGLEPVWSLHGDTGPLKGVEDILERAEEVDTAIREGREALREAEKEGKPEEPELHKRLRKLQVGTFARAQAIKGILERTPEAQREGLLQEFIEAKLVSERVMRQIQQLTNIENAGRNSN